MPKAFVPCAGRELWEWSADVLREVCDRVVMAVPPGYEGEGRAVGGSARSESVRNALDLLPDAEIVVVHDAARPLVTAELIRACVAEVESGWDGAVAAAPVTDTIKEADRDRAVVRTLDRSALWAIQTPQAFDAAMLRKALQGDVAAATDDASLVEAAGGRIRVVEAPAQNFKVTWPDDIARAEAHLC